MYTNYYYNPYMNQHFANRKKFNFKKLDFNKILNGTSKTLNVINQAIPIYYQVKPIIANAKTLFRVANILKSDSVVDNVVDSTEVSDVASAVNDSNPTFFL